MVQDVKLKHLINQGFVTITTNYVIIKSNGTRR